MSNDDFWKKMGQGWYIFENGRIRPAKDVLEAAAHLSDMKARQIDFTKINETTVSTVFLGCDHNLSGNGLPILFETLIRGGRHDGRIWRCATLGQAKQMHWDIVDALQSNKEPRPRVGEESQIWRMLKEIFGDES